jgi:hypothetical protein
MSDSCSYSFNCAGIPLDTPPTGGWVEQRAGVYVMAKGKLPSTAGNKIPVLQLVVVQSHY